MSQTMPMTPASADPLVATLFAIACRKYGSPIVVVVPTAKLTGIAPAENLFGTVECEIAIPIRPMEFAERAIIVADADVARDVLSELKFLVAAAIPDANALTDALLDSHRNGFRLTAAQIQDFVAEVERRSR